MLLGASWADCRAISRMGVPADFIMPLPAAAR